MPVENPYHAPRTAEMKPAKPLPTLPGKRNTWLASAGVSFFSVYAPYIVMALYTQIYVACDHCKSATLQLLAPAPALLPLEFAQRAVGLPPVDHWIAFTIAAFFALLWIAGLTLLWRRTYWLGLPASIVTFLHGSWLAIVLLAMIRM